MKKQYEKVLFTLVIIVLISLIPTSTIGNTSDYQQYSFNVPDSLKNKVDLWIQQDLTEIEINSISSFQTHKQMVVTVLTRKGLSSFPNEIYYTKGDQIKNAKAIIFDCNGNEIEIIKQNNFSDQSSFDGYSLQNDGRVKFFEHSQKLLPLTIVFYYTKKSSNTAFLPTWYPLTHYSSHVSNSSFKVTNNTKTQLRFKAYNMDKRFIHHPSEENQLIFEVTHLSAIYHEEFSPSISTFIPKLKIALNQFSLGNVKGYGSNWFTLGNWMNKQLLEGQNTIPDETQSQLHQLVDLENDTLTKAKLVFEYMQSKTRYVSIQEGIGGWKPTSAQKVDELGYGDCKALTNYTKSLLETVGIKSYYCIINADLDPISFDPEFACMSGNHAILLVPIGRVNYFLECTSQTTPFGYLSAHTNHRNTLVLFENSPQLLPTNSQPHHENKVERNINMTIDCSLKIKVNEKAESRGEHYQKRQQLLHFTKREEIQFYEDKNRTLRNFELKSNITTNNKELAQITEEITYSCDGLIKNHDQNKSFQIGGFTTTKIPRKYKQRQNPFDQPKNSKEVLQFYINLPNVLTILSLPENVEIKSKFGEYSTIYTQIDSHQIKCTRILIFYKTEGPAREYTDFRNFLKQVKKLDNQLILLTSNP